MFWDVIPQGTASRWAIGLLVVLHLITYNESGATGAVFAVIIASIHATFSVFCKNSSKNIQIPYLRATNRGDFLILYLALWMEILSLLAACGTLVRTLSTCLDAMTGGLARIYILGRNATDSEPWPDVLGVAIVFLVTGMFMLGLENTKIFSILMISGVFGILTILTVVTWTEGSLTAWTNGNILPAGTTKLLSSSALAVIVFPHEIPSSGRYQKLYGLAIVLIVLLSNILVSICLSTIVNFSPPENYEAVPIIPILEQKNFSKLVPAVACLLVISMSGAILELFPELYNLIVQLASTEWKILAKPIAFENRESGSPCLAVFIAGSLCGILAFACPLENMAYIMAGSHISAGILRGFYFLYSPYRPKFLTHQNDSATLSYSRLTTQPSKTHSRSTKIIQFLRKKSITQSYNPMTATNLRKTKKPSEEVEREWLLLGEPPSPKILEHGICQAESSILSDDNATTDTECIGTVKPDNTDSDSSEDIDAIVDEYREKVKVSIARPIEASVKLPTNGSWQIAYVMLVLFIAATLVAGIGSIYKVGEMFFGGVTAAFFFSFSMVFLPKYNNDHTPSLLTCSLCLLSGGILLVATFDKSWLALALWLGAGIIFYIRCDTWCCLCLDNRSGNESLLPNSTSTTKIVRLPSGLPSHNVLHECR